MTESAPMPLYNEFTFFLKKYFPYKVQKISLNAGFTCPNRDGTKGLGGCTYCNNQTFNPEYCKTEKSVTRQLEEGKQFFAHKYPDMKYLAYFQAYTNTYDELEGLKRKYEEALSVDGVVGLVIGTRPDCMPDPLLHYLEELNKHSFLLVEYGIETTRDATLKRINRGHTYADTVACPPDRSVWYFNRGTHHSRSSGREPRRNHCPGGRVVTFAPDYSQDASVALDTWHENGT